MARQLLPCPHCGKFALVGLYDCPYCRGILPAASIPIDDPELPRLNPEPPSATIWRRFYTGFCFLFAVICVFLAGFTIFIKSEDGTSLAPVAVTLIVLAISGFSIAMEKRSEKH